MTLDLGAMSRRVLDVCQRDAALKAAVRTFRWGNAPLFDYAGSKPLLYVAPSRAPVTRRDIGAGSGRDRHVPQEVTSAIEVILATAAEPTATRAQAAIWDLARMVEAAIGANSQLRDADSANPMAVTTRISTYQRYGPNVGGTTEALTVLLIVSTYEWPGATS